MSHSRPLPLPSPSQAKGEEEEDNHGKTYQHCRDLVSSTPGFDGFSVAPLHRHDGWFAPVCVLANTMVAQQHFQARPTDVILATLPKSGTTWLKALLFATVNRSSNSADPRPPWDHVLSYWKGSSGGRNKVLFVTYEELVEDPVAQLKRLAEFVQCPFTAEEEKDGVVESIVGACGFESLRDLAVNKTGKTETARGLLDNSDFFRRGGVGDWMNHLTPEMARRIDEITESKFSGIGIKF